jgi:tRNA (Thr-GGU) A37 N-methylase
MRPSSRPAFWNCPSTLLVNAKGALRHPLADVEQDTEAFVRLGGTVELEAAAVEAPGKLGIVLEGDGPNDRRKADNKTFIVVGRRREPTLLGVENLKSIRVLYWFDRNDSPANRSILQIHPCGDTSQPLPGVFAPRFPFCPNLIALSNANVLAVRENVIEIDSIDTFADTPVPDLKP